MSKIQQDLTSAISQFKAEIMLYFHKFSIDGQFLLLLFFNWTSRGRHSHQLLMRRSHGVVVEAMVAGGRFLLLFSSNDIKDTMG